MVAWLRTCGLAEFSSASEMTGNCSTTAGCAATSAIVAAAPSLRPCGPTSMRLSRRPARLTSRSGRRTSSCRSCTMSVPPAMYSAGASLRPAWARKASAAARSRGRSRVKGCMAQPPRTGTGRARRVLDGRDDVVVGAAAAQVAAHPVADLLRRAGVALVDAGDAGHDLPGRAIAALEGVALDEGGLQRMELLALGQALDGRDLAPLHEGGEREARLSRACRPSAPCRRRTGRGRSPSSSRSDAGARAGHRAAWCADRASADARFR